MIRFKKDSDWFHRLSAFGIERAVNSIFWISSEGRLLYSNDVATDIYGFTREELTDFSLTNLEEKTDETAKLYSKSDLKPNPDLLILSPDPSIGIKDVRLLENFLSKKV